LLLEPTVLELEQIEEALSFPSRYRLEQAVPPPVARRALALSGLSAHWCHFGIASSAHDANRRRLFSTTKEARRPRLPCSASAGSRSGKHHGTTDRYAAKEATLYGFLHKNPDCTVAYICKMWMLDD
jgi:hypothetical protein